MRAKLFSTYSHADASFRLRMQPLETLLMKRGWQVSTASIFTDRLYHYRNRNLICKVMISLVIALRILRRAISIIFSKRIDLCIIHREAFPFATPLFEKILRRKSAIFLLDFDDAIYVDPPHSKDWRKPFRSSPSFSSVVALADCVTTASPILSEWAKQYNDRVLTIPTLPPARKIVKDFRLTPEAIIWIGSDSTSQYLETCIEEVASFARKAQTKVFVLGGDKMSRAGWPEAVVIDRWSADREDALLSMNAVGIMPLTDGEWSRGKGSYKMLQYMSAGLPVIVSPIGLNSEILTQAACGLSASNSGEWSDALQTIWECAELRENFSKNGYDWIMQAREEVLYNQYQELFDWLEHHE